MHKDPGKGARWSMAEAEVQMHSLLLWPLVPREGTGWFFFVKNLRSHGNMNVYDEVPRKHGLFH